MAITMAICPVMKYKVCFSCSEHKMRSWVCHGDDHTGQPTYQGNSECSTREGTGMGHWNITLEAA